MNINDEKPPTNAPCNWEWVNLAQLDIKFVIMIHTRLFAKGKNIPSVNIPRTGPPTIPKIPNAA